MECIETNTTKVLQDQEKDLMRAFRARMQDVARELEHQRELKGDYSTELQARHDEMLMDLRASRELAQSFERRNEQLEGERKGLAEALEAQEDDRWRLLEELGTIVTLPGAPKVSSGLPSSGTSGGSNDVLLENSGGSGDRANADIGGGSTARSRMTNSAYERELRYRKTIDALRDRINSDKLSLKYLREAIDQQLRQRSEIEVFLQQCIDDVKNEISLYQKQQCQRATGDQRLFPGYSEEGSLGLGDATSMTDNIDTVHDCKATPCVLVPNVAVVDRERALELLLGQERIVQVLHQKIMEGRDRHDRSIYDNLVHEPSGSFPSQVQLWSREAAVRGLISEELLPRLLLCSGPDYAIRDVIRGSSTNRGGTFDIGDVAVQSFPIDASLSNGYRYELTLRPAVWHDPQLSDEFQTTPQAGVYDISKAFENGVFVPPPEPQKPPIRGYSGVKQTSYKEFPFVNYFDLHALDYPRCRDHLIGLAALTGNFRQAIGFLFARGYGNIDDASRAFDAYWGKPRC
ncbi:hypothetical protein Pmar_PMAR026254 [Perkinsus marinus ATCC 50983]|uniref:Uncharacterized protein n=1 Tax=Perkinsus marinus (strain ATCC 50983 / TXsc) TaxID=423536 RepID=C5LI43_PERM5|nr:hypothetical protein Pmar_PMAR026254 [Perkinsus marinus ATCC 50983]EER03578.1 hypothetical protein Pmar_PMAR026254 [Perkinsus marinus ATCC 50983]|eukprot:XP_002771762.1 hypothetical protein Pmar_PMAR026254 [Perkinsus marinus ATCC 50983]